MMCRSKMHPKRREALVDIGKSVGLEEASTRSLVVLGHNYKESHDRAGDRDQGGFAHKTLRLVGEPYGREQVPRQLDNVVLMTLLIGIHGMMETMAAGIQGTMQTMVAMLARKNANMSPSATSILPLPNQSQRHGPHLHLA